ncbi:MAG: S8 family serine peptidase [Bacteroidales bacterium]|nr:S8 family serine peptidase [Bacteroidales bacterium]
MIKKVLLTSIYYFLALTMLSGQTINLRNGEIKNPEYYKAKTPSKRQLKSDTNPLSGFYCIIQFNHALNENDQTELQKKGIELLKYIPDNSYTAVITNQEAFKFEQVKYILDIPVNFKYDLRLDEESDLWFKKEQNHLDINLVLAQGTNSELAITYLKKKFDIEILSKITSNILTLRIENEDLYTIASLNWVEWIEPVLTDFQLNNSSCSQNQRINYITNNTDGTTNLSGDGIWVGVWDGGAIGSHFDISGRVTTNTDQKENTHSTHVVGTIGGRGLIDPEAKGMATNVNVYASDINHDISGIVNNVRSALDNYDLSVNNNSWGPGFEREFCSDPVPYTSEMVIIDQLSLDFPTLTQVYANGNQQTKCHLGFGTTTWTMKNVIFVGASNDSSAMSNFSSFGPMFDGRLTPHICADGVDVMSTQDNNKYDSMNGTSMATPVITGGIALLDEKYKNQYNTLPTSDLVKAIVCNSANDINELGPDYKYGFGVANFKKAINTIEQEQFFQSELSTTNKTKEHQITVPENCSQLKVTICWNDLPGTPMSGKVLVNDLDILLKKDSQEWKPWILDPTKPINTATRGNDHINNIEQITINNPEKGNYIIDVNAFNIVSTQAYSISYDFIISDIEITFPRGGEKLVTGNSYVFQWDNGNSTSTYNVNISYDGINWESLATNLKANHNYLTFTIPNTVSNNAKLQVSNGSKTAESSIFYISPNLEIEKLTQGFKTVSLEWKAIEGISKYNIYEIKETGLVKAGESNSTEFTINNLETGSKYWYSISPVFDNGKEGARNKAIEIFSIPEYDIAVKEIINPWPGSHLESSEQLVLRIKNVGANTIPENTLLKVGYSLNNGTIKSLELTTDEILEKGKTIDIIGGEKLFMETPGYYTIKAWVKYSEDITNNGNDTIYRNVSKDKVIENFPYQYGFEGQLDLVQLINTVFDPVNLCDGWLNDRKDDDFDWWPVRGPAYRKDNGPREGYKGGKYLYTEASLLPSLPATANLISPSFDLMRTSKPQLKFYYHIWGEQNDMGSLHIDVYKQNSDTWESDVISPLTQYGVNEWKCCMVDLSKYKYEGVIRIRFRMESSESIHNSIAIDEFEISEAKQHDFEVLSVKPVSAKKLFTNNEAVSIEILNMGQNTYEVGTEIPVSYNIDGVENQENIITETIISPLDTIKYEFNKAIDLSNLTKRYNLDAWSNYSNDQYKLNDSIRDNYVQTYVETKSNCIANNYFIGIGYFQLSGISENLSVENTTICENTNTQGYSFYNDHVIRMYAGKKYGFSLRCLTPPPAMETESTGVYYKMWIDFNQDGHFGAEESVYQNNWQDYILLSDSIPIPSDLTFTGKTRLRIQAAVYKEDINETGDTEEFILGETEDYIVDLRKYPEFDVEMKHFITMPASGLDLPSDQKVSFIINNKGINNISTEKQLHFAYCVNNSEAIEQSFNLTKELTPESTIQLTFDQTVDLSKLGKYNIKLWLTNGDENEINDTLYYRVQCLGLTNAENYFEDFENGTGNWFDASESNVPVWQHCTPAKSQLNTAGSGEKCWVTLKDQNYPNNGKLVLQSPVFDFTNVKNPKISFALYLDTENEWDGMILEVKKPNRNWEKIGASEDGFYNCEKTENPDWNFRTPWWSGYTGAWINKTVTLPELAELSSVSFRFRFNSDQYENDEGAGIDAFKIESTSTTDVNDITTNKDITVYPNPSNGQFKIVLNNAVQSNTVIEIESMEGKSIYNTSINAQTDNINIDVSQVPEGIYIIRIQNNIDLIQSKILITK